MTVAAIRTWPVRPPRQVIARRRRAAPRARSGTWVIDTVLSFLQVVFDARAATSPRDGRRASRAGMDGLFGADPRPVGGSAIEPSRTETATAGRGSAPAAEADRIRH